MSVIIMLTVAHHRQKHMNFTHLTITKLPRNLFILHFIYKIQKFIKRICVHLALSSLWIYWFNWIRTRSKITLSIFSEMGLNSLTSHYRLQDRISRPTPKLDFTFRKYFILPWNLFRISERSIKISKTVHKSIL